MGPHTHDVTQPGGLDVIETYKADVRRRRWPWVVAGGVALVVLATVLIAPRVQDHRVTADLRWLQARWVEAGAYETARYSELNDVLVRALPDDVDLVRDAVIAVHREVASALRGLADRIGDHRAAGSAARLRSRMATVLTAEAVGLEELQLPNRQLTEGVPPLSEAVNSELQAVTSALDDEARRHGVKPAAKSPTVELHGGDAALQRMARLLDGPATGAVVLSDASGSDVRRLPDGELIRSLPPTGDIVGIVGTSVVTLNSATSVLSLMPAYGGRATTIGDVEFAAPTGGGHVWLMSPTRRVWQVDESGRQTVAPKRAPSEGYFAQVTDSAIVINSEGEFAAPAALWYPATGKRMTLNECGANAGSARFILFSNCRSGAQARLSVIDTRTRRTQTLAYPAGLTQSFDGTPYVTADSRRVVVPLARGAQQQAEKLGVLDLSTNRWSFVPAIGEPVGSSADGRRIYFLTYDPSTNGTIYRTWSIDDPVVRPLRLPSADGRALFLPPAR